MSRGRAVAATAVILLALQASVHAEQYHYSMAARISTAAAVLDWPQRCRRRHHHAPADDGEQARFSMTDGTSGSFADFPLNTTDQPSSWMQVELTIDATKPAPTLAGGMER